MPEFSEDAPEDANDCEAEPSFAWFAVALPVAEPPPAPLRLPAFANAIQIPEGETPGQPATALLAAEPAAGDAPVEAVSIDAAGTAVAGEAQDAGTVDFKLPMPGPAATAPVEAAADASAPIRVELPPAKETATPVRPPALATVQPPRAETVQPLAAPLIAAALEAPAPRRAAPREITIAALATSSATAEAPRPHLVLATPDAQQPALDMNRHDWMTSMVERIEALRDTPGTRETSIRLSPDALGTVDISIRHEGDRVHVRFSADTPAARAALAEAQPRLAELAESRGLKLGQTSVDGGGPGQGSQRHDAAPRPAFTAAPTSALGGDSESTDQRIA
ncbi:MAG: flagellar hook-length control protein FliK [Pseudomonadota bacterium]